MTDYRTTSTNPTPHPLGELDRPHGEVVPESQAKQGRQGFSMLAVLLVSLALIVVVFGGLYLFRSHPAGDATPQAASARTAGATRGTT